MLLTGKNNRAFTLAEVIVAAAIVASSLIFIMQAMGKEISVLSYSNDMTETSLFLKSKVQEITEYIRKEESISEFSKKGVFKSGKRPYAWAVEVTKETAFKGIYGVKAVCSWKKAAGRKTNTLESRVYKNPDEEYFEGTKRVYSY